MRPVPTLLRVLLAAIVLIAGSAIANASDLAGEVFAPTIEVGVGGGGVARPAKGSDQSASPIAATDQDSHDGCRQDCCMNCVHSPGSGCCTANVPFVGGCGVLDRALIAAHGIMDTGFLASGIDPEALLQPPQIVA